MPHSFGQIYLHIVFSTKHRYPYLQDRELRSRLHAYLSSACHGMKCPSLIVGGVADHVHILCRLSRTITVADLLLRLKKESSKWIKQQDPAMDSFYWQEGYGAFSTGPKHLEPLRRYIANQEAHHQTEDFQSEYRRLLAAYNLEYDERYVWD